MAKNKNKIPAFKSIEEEAEFWDTHDVTDFIDEEDVQVVLADDFKVVVLDDSPRDQQIVVRVQHSFKQRLENIARPKGLDVSTLARMWLTEKLQGSH